jgi:5-formyltetrahydrofolate cyclo-ligase
MRAVLRNLDRSSGPVVSAVHSWLNSRPDLRTLTLFAPLPGEVDLLPLLDLYPDRRWVFPRVEGDTLVLHEVRHLLSELVVGMFGIREPVHFLPVISPSEIDAFLCPGLAFDPAGGRLGRGRGFYDRILETARPDSLKVGIGFTEQLVPTTFAETHDIPMSLVISA